MNEAQQLSHIVNIIPFKLDYLEGLPTLCTGQADNLKIEHGIYQVWLSRCGIEDGEPYDNKVTIKHLSNGHWINYAIYPAA